MNRKNRNNQDQYDVIQAKEEFESMVDPRTLVLKQEVAELEEKVSDLEDEIKEIKSDEYNSSDKEDDDQQGN